MLPEILCPCTTMCINILIWFMYICYTVYTVLYLGFLFVNIFWRLFHINTKSVWLILFHGNNSPYYDSIICLTSSLFLDIQVAYKDASVSILIYVLFSVCVSISLYFITRSRITGSRSTGMANFYRSCQISSHKHFTSFNFHQN